MIYTALQSSTSSWPFAPRGVLEEEGLCPKEQTDVSCPEINRFTSRLDNRFAWEGLDREDPMSGLNDLWRSLLA